jgi:hypothetical protein
VSVHKRKTVRFEDDESEKTLELVQEAAGGLTILISQRYRDAGTDEGETYELWFALPGRDLMQALEDLEIEVATA